MLCFHQCYFLASSFLILLEIFEWKECFVGCWLCIGILEKKKKLCFWPKSCFFPGENIVQDVVFSYIKVVFAASRLPVRPLYICCGGNVKTSKDKGSTFSKTSVDNIIFIESHISYWLPRSSCEPRPPSQYRKSGDMRKITKILKITSYSE